MKDIMKSMLLSKLFHQSPALVNINEYKYTINIRILSMVALKNNVYNWQFENRFRTTFLHTQADVRKLGNTCIAINLPTIILGFAEQPTNIRKIWIPGDSLEFEDCNLQFLLQESMENWLAVMDWIFRLRDPAELLSERDTCDLAVDVLDARYNTVVEVTLIDVFPFTMSDVPLTAQIDDAEPSRFDVSFKINGFTYKSVSD
jgi:hypothetical protein